MGDHSIDSDHYAPSAEDLALRPLPNVNDPETSGFFAAAKDGRLAVKACADCGLVLHLPKAYCHGCGGWNTVWRSVRPEGKVYTWTTTERELRAGFRPPYTVVLVELDEVPGVRMAGYVPGRPEIAVGTPMRAVFTSLSDDVTMPEWQLA